MPESIARIQLNTGEKSFVAQHEIFYGLCEVEVLDGFVLGIEEDTHTIVAINIESNQLVGRVPVLVGPEASPHMEAVRLSLAQRIRLLPSSECLVII